MRALYRADPRRWIDLAEPAAFEVGDVIRGGDECGPERPGAGEALARCHRRMPKALLIAVPTVRVSRSPRTRAPSSGRYWKCGGERCSPPRGSHPPARSCQRPADTARGIRGRDGYG